MNLKSRKQIEDGLINQIRGGKPNKEQFESFKSKALQFIQLKPGTVTSMGKTYLALQVKFADNISAGEVPGCPALNLAKVKKQDGGVILLYAADGGWAKGDIDEEETNLEYYELKESQESS